MAGGRRSGRRAGPRRYKGKDFKRAERALRADKSLSLRAAWLRVGGRAALRTYCGLLLVLQEF